MAGNNYSIGAICGSYCVTLAADTVVRLSVAVTGASAVRVKLGAGLVEPRGVLVQCGTAAQIVAGARTNGALLWWLEDPVVADSKGLHMIPGDIVYLDDAQACHEMRYMNAVAGSNATLKFIFCK